MVPQRCQIMSVHNVNPRAILSSTDTLSVCAINSTFQSFRLHEMKPLPCSVLYCNSKFAMSDVTAANLAAIETISKGYP